MKPPTIFISYWYDSPAHKQWVLKVATDLVERGIEVIIDEWDLSLGQDVAAFMESSISRADRVLLVCTPDYVAKADEGRGGVGYERLIVSAEVVERIHTKKFIPWFGLPRRRPESLAFSEPDGMWTFPRSRTIWPALRDHPRNPRSFPGEAAHRRQSLRCHRPVGSSAWPVYLALPEYSRTAVDRFLVRRAGLGRKSRSRAVAD